jgi:hypothetical protein
MNVCKGGSFYFLGVKERKRTGEKVESVGEKWEANGVRAPVWFQGWLTFTTMSTMWSGCISRITIFLLIKKYTNFFRAELKKTLRL